MSNLNMMRRLAAYVTGLLLALALGACGSSTPSANGSANTGTAGSGSTGTGTGTTGNTGAAAGATTTVAPGVTEAPTVAATTAPPATSPPPAATSPAATCYIDPEGNCYRAGEYCPTSLYGKTVQGSSGPITCVDNNGWRWENA